MNSRPPQGNTTIILIVYNCSQPINLKRIQTFQSSHFTVKPTYQNNKCDIVKSNLNNQQGTLSATLTTVHGGNCKGLSSGAIIGIVLGVVGGALIIILIFSFIFWKRDRDFDKKFGQIAMVENPNSWKSNENHQPKTKWTDNK